MSLCSVDSHNRSATCRSFLVCTASWYHSTFALEFCVLESALESATCRHFLDCTASWYHSTFALKFCVLDVFRIALEFCVLGVFRSQCCDEVCWLSFGCERRIRRETFHREICHVQTFSGLYRIMISFHICFRILCSRRVPNCFRFLCFRCVPK